MHASCGRRHVDPSGVRIIGTRPGRTLSAVGCGAVRACVHWSAAETREGAYGKRPPCHFVDHRQLATDSAVHQDDAQHPGVAPQVPVAVVGRRVAGSTRASTRVNENEHPSRLLNATLDRDRNTAHLERKAHTDMRRRRRRRRRVRRRRVCMFNEPPAACSSSSTPSAMSPTPWMFAAALAADIQPPWSYFQQASRRAWFPRACDRSPAPGAVAYRVTLRCLAWGWEVPGTAAACGMEGTRLKRSVTPCKHVFWRAFPHVVFQHSTITYLVTQLTGRPICADPELYG